MDWNNRIIEAVINVSVGRDHTLIKAIAATISSIENVELLHYDAGWDADRTVYTMIGEIEAVFKATYGIFSIAGDKVDMNYYVGNHPAIGSVDVVPFVPIKNVTIEELQTEVSKFGKEISRVFKLPLIYYGNMATQGSNKNLSSIRRGGVNKLNNRIKSRQLIVDSSEEIPHPKMGATCWTVRNFMLAYNINLNTDKLEIAQKIASDIRKERKTNGSLQNVKILGWATPHFKCCQISTNIYNLSEMTMSKMFDLTKRAAVKYDIQVVGSELIGMTPLKGLCHDADFDNLERYVNELGLDSVVEFNPQKRILEMVLNINKSLL